MSIQNLHAKQTRFVITYTISLLLCFSPFKSLSIVTPFLIIFLLLFFVKVRSVYNLLRLWKFFLLYVIIGGLYFIINRDFLWFNFFFYILTFGSFLLLILSFQDVVDGRLIDRMARATIIVLFVESIYGIVQVVNNAVLITHGFDGGTGDAAMGTINPRFNAGDGSASNVYFAIGLSGLAILSIVSKVFTSKKTNTVVVIVILSSWVLASVMHSIFLLLAAIVATLVLLVFFMPKRKLSFFQRQLKAIRSIMGITLVACIILFVALPGNVELVQNYYENTFDPDKMTSPKSIATLATLRDLNSEKPFSRYIGLGPGQYTSRSSLILSDSYLNSTLPPFLKSVSKDFEKHILPIWLTYKNATFQAGSTFFPFYSWLSLFGEWGLVGVLALLYFITRMVRKLVVSVNPKNFYLVIGLLVIIFYLALLGIQDNYWEWGQFILPILLFAKTVYYMCMKEKYADEQNPS